MIYTGNYNNCKGDICVSISGDKGKNANFKGKAYTLLAPKRDFFSTWRSNIGKIPEEENNRYYIKEFCDKVLKNLDPNKVYSDLDGSILLCYEKENEFCHRHLVAFWLEEFLNITVDEVKICNGNLIKLYRPEYLREMLLKELK